MKKLLTLIVLLSVPFIFLNGQIYFQERFDDPTMPEGWQAETQLDNWVISNTNKAGGEPNELFLKKNPTFNDKVRMVSPTINMTGVTESVIEFNYCFDNLAGGHIVGVETTSGDGNTWTAVYQSYYVGTKEGVVAKAITTSDLGSANFKFCIFYQGDINNTGGLYFDNVVIYKKKNLNAGIYLIETPSIFAPGDHNFTFNIINRGSSTISSIQASIKLNDGTALTETFTGINLASLGTKALTFSQAIDVPPGENEVTIEILKVNGGTDDDPSDNILTKSFNVIKKFAERKVCIEHFTSSTCPPCVPFNVQMGALLDSNPGKYGITKYQMNWPAQSGYPNGDPYYTAEGGVRRTYYNVSGVPDAYFNGKKGNANQNVFNTALAEPAYVEIFGSQSVEGNIVKIYVAVTSYLDLPGAKMYVVVNEKTTTGNATPFPTLDKIFHHVMMKMVPNAQGTTVTEDANKTSFFYFEQDMTGTHVEEMDDLEVHVFLQDNPTKYVYNSSFLGECVGMTLDPTNFTGTSIDNSVTLTWTDAQGTSDRFLILFNGEIIEENINTTTYTHLNVPEGTHTYGVVAVDGECISKLVEKTVTVTNDCDGVLEPTNFIGEQVENLYSVALSWEDGNESSDFFTIYFNGAVLVGNTTETSYIHEGVAIGTHTYGIVAVDGECTSKLVEKTVTVEQPQDCEGVLKPTNFTGKQVEGLYDVILSWEDGNEPSDFFTIYFNGEVLVENTTETSYTHEGVEIGIHTYGIVAVVGDCKTEILNIEVEVETIGINIHDIALNVFPNPAKENISIICKDMKEILMYNNVGQLIKSITTSSDAVQIFTDDISAGLYHIKVVTNSGATKTEKIVITK